MYAIPAPLATIATRNLACSALPDAPVEPDRVTTRQRVAALVRALFSEPSVAVPSRASRRTAKPGRVSSSNYPARVGMAASFQSGSR